MIYNCYRYYNKTLLPGDLVFFKAFSAVNNNFISSIISSSQNAQPIYHVAMIIKNDETGVYLIESVPKAGVVVSQYKNLCQTHGWFGDIEVTRVNLPDQYVQQAVSIAIGLVGRAYNDIFSSDFINSDKDQAFYCSQLIQFAYNIAMFADIFSDIKMTFIGEEGIVSQYWLNYYAERSATVPQDMPGSHPSSLYDSEYLICL